MSTLKSKKIEKDNIHESVKSTKNPHKHSMNLKPISAKVRFLASNFAAVISVTCCFPLELIKTRMQI